MAVAQETTETVISSDTRAEVKERTFQLRPISFPKTLSFLTNTQFLVILLIVGSFLLGSMWTKIQYLQQNATLPNQAVAQQAVITPQTSPTPPQRVTVEAGHLPILGNASAKVTIIEFADLRCPYCKQFYTDSEKHIITDYVNTGKAKFAFRHYAFLGPASTLAANAAECANEQGKFWDIYNYFYTNQPEESDTSLFTVDNLTPIAGNLGMNPDQFRTCLSANKYNQNVTDDFTAGQKVGVSGTPTTYINGMPLVGAVPYAQIKVAIDTELTK